MTWIRAATSRILRPIRLATSNKRRVDLCLSLAASTFFFWKATRTDDHTWRRLYILCPVSLPLVSCMFCKYCYEDGFVDLVQSPCHCKNSIHVRCLLKWFIASKTTHCPECGYDNLDRPWVAGVFTIAIVCSLIMEFCSTIKI